MMLNNQHCQWQIPGIIILFLMVLLSSCIPKSQKVYHVGILSGLDPFYTIIDGFKEKMTELGYEEGKNIVYDIQKSNFNSATYKNILYKFVANKVDLIFVFPTEASMEAKAATQGTGIPVVFANAFTEETGLVNSSSEPGGNITGVRWDGPDLALQRFEVMRELVPKAKQIWIPYQRGYPIVKSQLEVLRQSFKTANLTMIEIPADNATELEAALNSQIKQPPLPDAIFSISEPLCVNLTAHLVIVKFAAKRKIPICGNMVSKEGYGSLFDLRPQNIPQGKQAALLADKILKGELAGTIPLVSAENYLQINFKQAQNLGLKVNEALLTRANEVIR